MPRLLISTLVLALFIPCVARLLPCFPPDLATSYTELNGVQVWGGEVHDFCAELYASEDMILPSQNISCEGEASTLVGSVQALIGGTSLSCRLVVSNVVCLAHLPILLDDEVFALPCGSNDGSLLLESLVVDACRDSPIDVTSVPGLWPFVRQLDAILTSNQTLRSSCRIPQAFDPAPFCPVGSIANLNGAGCQVPCSAPLFSAHSKRSLLVALACLNAASLLATISCLILMQRRGRSSDPMDRAGWHVLIGVAGTHAGLVLSSAFSLSLNHSSYGTTCAPNELVSPCAVQGALLLFFVSVASFSWLAFITALHSRLFGVNLLIPVRLNYVISLAISLVGLFTRKYGPHAHYPWCFAVDEFALIVASGGLALLAAGILVLIRTFIQMHPRVLANCTEESNRAMRRLLPRAIGIPFCCVLCAVLATTYSTERSSYPICVFERYLALLVDNTNVTALPAVMSAVQQCVDHTKLLSLVFTGVVAVGCWGLLASACVWFSVTPNILLDWPTLDHSSKTLEDAARLRHTPVVLWGKAGGDGGMSVKTFDVIVIGGGTAAYGLIKELSDSDPSDGLQVAVITCESDMPFSAPSVVQALATKQNLNQTFWKPSEWWEQPWLSVFVNTTIKRVDLQHKSLVGYHADTAESLCFVATKALVIATGAVPNIGPHVTHVQAMGLIPRWSQVAMQRLRNSNNNNNGCSSQPMPRRDNQPQQQQQQQPRKCFAPSPTPPAHQPRPESSSSSSPNNNTDDLNNSANTRQRPLSMPHPSSLTCSKDPSGLFRLRTFASALELNGALDQHDSAVVIGGGLLALDLAYLARERGLRVTVVCPSARILTSVFDPELSRMYQEFFEAHRVRMIMNTSCETITAQYGAVTGVQLSSGETLMTGLALVACGVRPNVELFKGQVQLERNTQAPGILVDPFLMTSVPGVYAIGDVCALRFTQSDAGSTRHYLNALNSGKHVAQNLVRRAGAEHCRKPLALTNMRDSVRAEGAYVPHPTFELNHFGLRCFVLGDRLGPDVLLIVGPQRESDANDKPALVARDVLVLWLWENRVVGGFVSGATTAEELEILDDATRNQWHIRQVPVLRKLGCLRAAFEHLAANHD